MRPGVLVIYLGKPEIPVGKSNGSRCFVRKASRDIECDLRWCNFSTLFDLLCWFGLYFVAGRSLTFSIFLFFLFRYQFFPRVVWVNGKHPSSPLSWRLLLFGNNRINPPDWSSIIRIQLRTATAPSCRTRQKHTKCISYGTSVDSTLLSG